MREIEDAVFALGHTPIDLMLQAGKRMSEVILRYYPQKKAATAFISKGHNAGDALVVLKHLSEAGWEIAIRSAFEEYELAPLTQEMLGRLGAVHWNYESSPAPGSLLIDALLGIGAQGPLRPPLAELASTMNQLRLNSGCTVVALDTPSGIDGSTGEVYAEAVEADHTLCVGLPKSGLLTSSTINHVGAITLVPLDSLIPHYPTFDADALQLITPQSLKRKLRNFDTHKGRAGRVGIWAGSEGMLGAAALTATAALKAGAGLITLFTTPHLYPTLASMVPHEIILNTSDDPLLLLQQNFDALVLGPGMGTPNSITAKKLLELIEKTKLPTVVDADMLNLIAHTGNQQLLSHHCILTPHPGEMQRLFPSTNSREETARAFCKRYPSTLLYKGARTIVSAHNEALYINSSGTPAMATAGQGDVLSGLIAGLCAQRYSKIEAAKLGAWLTGEAAQIALAKGTESQETLTASSVLNHLHKAFLAVPLHLTMSSSA